MPAQLANESFRADHVRLGNSVGAVVQVLMRSEVPAAEAFFCDHLLRATWLLSCPAFEVNVEETAKPRRPPPRLDCPS
jgi:hypothetical protein